jgi:hypothetical protein
MRRFCAGAVDRGSFGDGATPGARNRATAAALSVLALTLTLTVSPVRAAETHPFVGGFGSFQNPQSLAVDQSSGAVYVLDAGARSVSRFDAEGNPVNFSAVASYVAGNALTGTSEGAWAPAGPFSIASGISESQIAVAPPGAAGGTGGDVYVTEVEPSGNGSIAVFASSGQYLGRIDGSGNANPVTGGQPCGVAVGPTGALYVGYFSGHVDKYVPSANPPLNADFDSEITGLGGICNVAASGSFLFVSTWSSGPLNAFSLSLFPGGGGEADASSSGIPIQDEGSPAKSTTVGVDPSNGDFYVDEESQIAQFDAAGSLVGHSGASQLSLSHGVAVDASGGSTDGNLYAANGEPGEVEVFGPAVLLPDATTGEATSVTANTATLNGTVNAAAGPAATCTFQYVNEAAFQAGGFAGAATAPCSPAGPFTGSSDNAVSAALTGLTAQTTYHFRLVASSENGTNPGAAATFTTPAAVLLATGEASNITGESATLNGFINPQGVELESCSFEYGETETYGTTVPCAESPAEIGSGSGVVEVHADLSGLELATTYHFRLVASNAKGTSKGGDESFATLGPRVSGETASEISDTSAKLEGLVNPRGEATTYRFQYVSDASFQESDYAEAITVPPAGAAAGAGIAAVPVAQQLSGLSPGTTYHFHLLASNPGGTAEGPDRTFTTFIPGKAGLLDGRAYELVSPRDTNGTFLAALSADRDNFDTYLASPSGESVIFYTQGTLPGMEGNGTIDSYEASRGAGGWSTRSTGPVGSQAVAPSAGGTSPDHRYSFWNSGSNGGSLDPGHGADYLRKPDGSFELIGRGSLGDDPHAEGRWITAGATHVVFTTEAGISVQLEPQAPPAGIEAIYDRTPGGPTHVVSLLPGDVTPGANAHYLGTAEDGSAVVFAVAGTMYERRDNSSTLEVAPGNPGFAGISSSGDTVFYTQAGNVFAFHASTETVTPIGSGGASKVVNVSADGSHVYFESSQQLDGAKGEPGAPNLYVWDGAMVRFVAVLEPSDFEGLVNLGSWQEAIGPVQTNLTGRAEDPSRTTPDGSVLVFQSHGVSTHPYDSEGRWEIYRYDASTGQVDCLSCSPTGSGAGSNAELESTGLTVANPPTNAVSRIRNVTDDGSTVFFQTGDALVLGDTDGVGDVYEWKEGRVALISSGRSSNANFLDGMTADGHDVFFKTGDALVPEDETGGSGSIYDARVGGGFPARETSPPCSEGSCQGPGSPPPALPAIGSSDFHGSVNAQARRHGRHHRKKRHRKARHRRANRNRGGAK